MSTITANGFTGYLNAGLAPRELEATLHAAGDLSFKEIARAMGVAPKTIEKRIESARLKLGNQRTVRGLVVEALRRGVITHCGVLALALLVGLEQQQSTFNRRPEGPRRAELRVIARRDATERVA